MAETRIPAVPTGEDRCGITARHMMLARDVTEAVLAKPRSTHALALHLARIEDQAVRLALARRIPAWLWAVLGVLVGLGLSEWWR